MSNYGWAILPRDGGGDGWAIATSESSEERARPRLRVYYDTNTVIPVNLVIEAPVVGSNGVQIHFAGSANPAYSTWRAAAVNGPW